MSAEVRRRTMRRAACRRWIGAAAVMGMASVVQAVPGKVGAAAEGPVAVRWLEADRLKAVLEAFG